MPVEQTPVVLASLVPDAVKFIRSSLTAVLEFPDGHQDSLSVPLAATANYERLKQFVASMSGGRWLLRSIAADRTDLPSRLRVSAAWAAEFRAAHADGVSAELRRMGAKGALGHVPGGRGGSGNATFAGASGASQRERLLALTSLGRLVLEQERDAAFAAKEHNPI
jgi:hypothetical protein